MSRKANITEQQFNAINYALSLGKKQTTVADMFNVSKQTVSRIKKCGDTYEDFLRYLKERAERELTPKPCCYCSEENEKLFSDKLLDISERFFDISVELDALGKMIKRTGDK